MYSIIKRFFDVLFSSISIIVLLPLMIPIVLGLLLTGEGYVWYFQERIGFKQKTFNIIKFATMLKDSVNMPGGIITTKNDPRITVMGSFLRKSKINELPQLINILKGDMSFVGPRPVMKKSFDQYPDDVKEIIYLVPPGLSGVGSIVFRDEDEIISKISEANGDTWSFYKNKIYPFKGRLEKWYQKNQSFLVDFKIIVLTLWVVFFPKSNLIYTWFNSLPKRDF